MSSRPGGAIVVRVLGAGCVACRTTLKLIGEIAKARSIPIDLQKIDDVPTIAGYGILSTPGIVIDGHVVHSGGVPSREKIVAWLESRQNSPV